MDFRIVRNNGHPPKWDAYHKNIFKTKEEAEKQLVKADIQHYLSSPFKPYRVEEIPTKEEKKMGKYWVMRSSGERSAAKNGFTELADAIARATDRNKGNPGTYIVDDAGNRVWPADAAVIDNDKIITYTATVNPDGSIALKFTNDCKKSAYATLFKLNGYSLLQYGYAEFTPDNKRLYCNGDSRGDHREIKLTGEHRFACIDLINAYNASLVAIKKEEPKPVEIKQHWVDKYKITFTGDFSVKLLAKHEKSMRKSRSLFGWLARHRKNKDVVSWLNMCEGACRALAAVGCN